MQEHSQKKSHKIYTYEQIKEDKEKFDEVYRHITKHGRHTISHSSLQPKMTYFIIEDVGFVAYMKRGKRTYVLGDPLCHDDDLKKVLEVFLKNNRHVCFLQTSKETIRVLGPEFKFYTNIFGSETIIENKYGSKPITKDFELERLKEELGSLEREKDRLYEQINDEESRKKFWKVKDLVHKLRKKVKEKEESFKEKDNFFLEKFLSGENKRFLRREHSLAKKENYSVREINSYQDLNLDYIKRISTWWLKTRKSSKEMAFLVRPLEEENLFRHDRRFFVLEKGKELRGFMELTPIHENHKIRGYYADIIRVINGSNQGCTNFFILEVMNSLFSEGHQIFSLGLSPFHNVAKVYNSKTVKRSDNPLVTSMFKILFKHGNSLYNAKGQAFHKEKFRAKMQPTFFCSKKRFPFSEIVGGFLVSGINPLNLSFKRSRN